IRSWRLHAGGLRTGDGAGAGDQVVDVVPFGAARGVHDGIINASAPGATVLLNTNCVTTILNSASSIPCRHELRASKVSGRGPGPDPTPVAVRGSLRVAAPSGPPAGRRLVLQEPALWPVARLPAMARRLPPGRGPVGPDRGSG